MTQHKHSVHLCANVCAVDVRKWASYIYSYCIHVILAQHPPGSCHQLRSRQRDRHESNALHRFGSDSTRWQVISCYFMLFLYLQWLLPNDWNQIWLAQHGIYRFIWGDNTWAGSAEMHALEELKVSLNYRPRERPSLIFANFGII